MGCVIGYDSVSFYGYNLISWFVNYLWFILPFVTQSNIVLSLHEMYKDNTLYALLCYGYHMMSRFINPPLFVYSTTAH